MAYRRNAHKPDIRSLPLNVLPVAQTTEPSNAASPNPSASIHIHPARELKRIAFCSIPLISLLIVASYLDATRHWVIPFAHWLFRIGS